MTTTVRVGAMALDERLPVPVGRFIGQQWTNRPIW
jgi:hypothetical protein